MLNFLNPKISAFGLDLSDLSIKIACAKKNRAAFYLSSFGRQEIPEGLIANGEIKKENELIGIIKNALSNLKGEALKTRYCVASLPETVSFVRAIKMPLMTERELAEAIKWEVEAHIPLTRNEIYYDWQIIGEGNAAADHLDVLLGVLPKKTVDPYLDVLKKAGLKPVVFEIEPVATARALIKNSRSEEPLIIIDLGARRASLFIFYGQAIYFTTELPINNSLIIDALSEKLGTSRAKALQIKMKVGLNLKHPTSRVCQTVKAVLAETTQKIKDYINFYNDHIMATHGDKKSIKKIILCGGGAIMLGLPEFLTEELKMPVEIGNPWANLTCRQDEIIPKLPTGEALSFATAFGLAIRDVTE